MEIKKQKSPQPQVDDRTRAKAIARVQSGERMATVASDIGVNTGTLSRWCKRVEGRYVPADADYERISEKAEEFRKKIEKKQDQVRDTALDKLLELLPEVRDTKAIKDVVQAYGVITDKALLSEGKPTSIYQESQNMPQGVEQLNQLAEELRNRRQASNKTPEGDQE